MGLIGKLTVLSSVVLLGEMTVLTWMIPDLKRGMTAAFAAMRRPASAQPAWRGQVQSVERLMLRMTQRTLFLSFARWVEVATRSSRARRIVARTLTKMSRRRLAMVGVRTRVTARDTTTGVHACMCD